MLIKSLSLLPEIKQAEAQKATPLSQKQTIKGLSKALHIFQNKKRELIAGGDIKWKPVNKEAAMLLSRSSDIFKPPLSQTPPMKEDTTTSGAMERGFVKAEAQLPKQLEEKVDLMRSVRASLDLATDMFRRDMIDFSGEMPTHLNALRQWRQSTEREANLSVAALRDLRKFFLDDQHQLEMQRLNEFVRTCERLSALAADGTLDKIAEVMLKLSK